MLLAVLTSCDQDKIYEKEQYKNVFAFVSDSDNIYEDYFDLSDAESVGYVSFSMGGSNDITEDVNISVKEDLSVLDNYNIRNYDMNISDYSLPMPESKYDVESLSCTIPAGEVKATMPIRIRPVGLSPDSTYFIPFRVDSYDRYEVNPEKSTLLFRVRIKNYWAKDEGTSYTLTGLRKESGSAEVSVPGVKTMHPISGNEVRVMAGTELFEQTKEVLNKGAIVLEVEEDNSVSVHPYRDIEVTQIDGDEEYPNIFKIVDDGFKTYKTFLIHYRYRFDGKEYEMKEELRLEFNPDVEED